MVLSSAIDCDHDRRIADDRRSMFPYDRRRSQTLLRSAICDPRSYGDQPLCSIFCDRLRSSAIMIAGSQTIAEVCFHMIADDRRQSQTLLRSAICDPRSYGNQPLYSRLTQGRHDIRQQFCCTRKTPVNTLFFKMFSYVFPRG